MLARLTSKFDKEQAQTLRQLQYDNFDQYKKALRDWLKLPKNKDANADEIYYEGREMLVHYRKTPDQLRKEAGILPSYTKAPTEWLRTKEVPDVLRNIKAKEKSRYPEYPNAFQENGIWKVVIDGKTYRIEE